MADRTTTLILAAKDLASAPLGALSGNVDKLGARTQALDAGFRLAGAGVSVALGFAAKGMIELDSAVTKYSADVGATQAETESAAKAATELFRNNRDSFDSILQTMGALRTDMGLTEAQAEKTTQSFLSYAKVTGQEGVGAVKALDDIQDAWNLSAGDSQGIMDKLVVSHQKWGGSIVENQGALATLAPQLQAMGASVDDGIGLLNLFAASGLDSSKAMAAMNKAVATLKPGQGLDDLVKQVSSIEDPTQRAQKAIEIFGARGGVGIANALKPGINSLKDFEVSQADAAGATQKAADIIESSLQNRLQRAIHDVSGALMQFAAPAGPILSSAAALVTALPALSKFGVGLGSLQSAIGSAVDVAGSFAGKITGVITGSLERLAGSAVITRASSAVGGAIGTAIGESQALGQRLAVGIGTALGAPEALAAGTAGGRLLGAAVGIGIVAGVAAAAPDVARVTGDIANEIHQNLSGLPGMNILGDIGKAWSDARANAPWPLGQKDAPDWAKLGNDAGAATGQGVATGMASVAPNIKGAVDGALALIPAGVTSALDQVLAKVTETGHAVGGSWDDSAEHFRATVTEKFRGTKDEVIQIADLLPPAAHKASADAMAALAQGISDARQKPLDAMNALTEALKKPLTETAETTRLLGELASKNLQKGLQSGDPAIREQARATKQMIVDRLNELEPAAGTIGKDGMAALERGIKSKDTDVRNAALSIKETAEAQLALNNAKAYGQHAAEAYAQGFASRADYLGEQVRIFLAAAQRKMVAASPPGPESPLHEIDKWGYRTAEAYADSFGRGMSGLAGHADRALSGVANVLGGAGFGAGGFSPALPGGGIGSAGGGTTVILSPNITVNGSDDPEQWGARFVQGMGRRLRREGLIA